MSLKWIVISIIVILCFSFNGLTQVLTTEPEFPTATDAVTIFFNADQGNQELKDFTGDIYAHTGLITNLSTSNSNWKYVIAGWSENTSKAKLTKVSSNYYKLEIQASIKEFYGVAEDEEILKIAFVFRNSDGSKVAREEDGGDIFADVYEPGLSLSITSPTDDYTILTGESIDAIASSNDADSMFLYIDDLLIQKVSGTVVNYTHTENISGSHKVKVIAKNSEDLVSDSVYYYARGDVNLELQPKGWVKGINYLADDSVGLVLFAPNKDYVFVIGDFTDWRLDEKYMMNKAPDSYNFWLPIGDLIPGNEYVFQYYIDGELKIADPYTEKTSDPNDKYISDETYPGLIDYPAAKTKNIASVLQTNQNEYEWINTDFIPPAKEKLIIYELLIRDFIAKHDYKTLTDTLNYLDSLGVNAIELMPFNEFEGNESWGYNPSFYFAPDKYYGPKEDLKAFIDSCHGRGIAVIMDMVLNHSYGQSPLVQMYFDGEKPTAENPWYNVTSPNTTYSWGYDFNHESVYTKELVDSVNRFWLEKYKLDGFRFDFTKGFTNTPGDGWSYDIDRINILKRMALRIWEVNSEAYVILEHLSENSEEKNLAEFGMMLWGNMNSQYNEATMGYSSDIDGASYKDRGWSVPNLVAYMESHDEERLMYKNIQYGNSTDDYNIKDIYTALHRVELAANFFIPIPGPKMIWQFGELGYDYSINYEDCRVCNKPIRWDYFTSNRRKLYYVFKALNELKFKYPVFSTSDFTITQTGTTKTIHLNDDEMDVLILGNFDVVSQDINPSFQNTGNWYEFYTGDTLNVTDTEELISLMPGEYRLYTNVKLDMPDIPLSIHTGINSNFRKVSVFPNPSSNFFYFHIENKELLNSELTIYNIQGQIVYNKMINADEIIEYNASEVQNGIYFYQIVDGKNIFSGKIIKQ